MTLFQCPECSSLHDAPVCAAYVLEVTCPECELLAALRRDARSGLAGAHRSVAALAPSARSASRVAFVKA